MTRSEQSDAREQAGHGPARMHVEAATAAADRKKERGR